KHGLSDLSDESLRETYCIETTLIREAGVSRSAFTSAYSGGGYYSPMQQQAANLWVGIYRCPLLRRKKRRCHLFCRCPSADSPRSCSQGSALLAGWLCQSVRQSVSSSARNCAL